MITDKVKAKVEAYMRTHYDAKDIIWGEDSCTVFSEQDKGIDDFMIDIDDDGTIYYTPVSDWNVTLPIEV